MENISSYSIGRENAQSKFLAATYGRMALALVISAAAAFVTASILGAMMASAKTEAEIIRVFSVYRSIVLFLAIGEIALVWWLSASISKISSSAAAVGFVVYSAVNGITFSSIFFVYQLGSIGVIFIACAAMFAVMSLYGMKTKSDLRGAGKYLMMGVIGIIIASVINMIINLITHQVGPLDWLISIATVIIFTGLTAYDSQKLLTISSNADGSETYKKVAIIGALELYLDFINMFFALLRLFGKKK